MQLSKTTYLLILVTILLNQKSITMGKWHAWSSEFEKHKPAQVETAIQCAIVYPQIIRSPQSLKLLAALTLINDCDLPENVSVSSDINAYLQFIKRNFHLTDRGYRMQFQALNDAILNNMYYAIPDVILFGRNIDNTMFLNNTDLPENQTPLLFAIEKENVKFAHMLLAAGANPNIIWSVTTRTPLLCAIKKRNAALAELLLAYKADIEQRNRIDGSTPLMQAAAMGDETIVRLLLKYGASKNSESNHGACAASLAKNNGHKEVYELVVTPEYEAYVASVKKDLGLS